MLDELLFLFTTFLIIINLFIPETKITEVENDLNESKLLQKYENMKAQRQQQEEIIENYKVQIAFLEHEVKTIKENAESLENRCFKRTRLEP